MKRLATFATLALLAAGLTACSDAEITSSNLSKAADQFEINRRIVFLNGITDKYLLSIEGRCSIATDKELRELAVTCKVADNQFKKHHLGLSDNVSYFVEQIDAADADSYHYRVIFKPDALVPDIDLETEMGK